MLLCLRGTRTPSYVDNIREIDLCAIVAESNIEWITYRFIPCYFMIINMYGYKYVMVINMIINMSSDLFLDIFCVYTQSSDAMRLIFPTKLTACFISNIYIYICWFHPFIKMCTSFKNRMCNGMSSFVKNFCFIQYYRRRRANNYRQQKKY